MKQRRRKILVAVGAILAIGLVALAVVRRTAVWTQVLVPLGLAKPAPRGIVASGFIEAEEVALAPEVGGRIAEILVEEGDEVETGQVLVRLDDTLAQAQVEVAQAGLEVAQAQLALVKAGARPEEIRQAEAALAQAEAARDGAYQAWQDALALLENPQEIDAQIAVAEAQLAQAEAAVRQTAALRDVAQIARDTFEEAIQSFPQGERRKTRVAHGTIEEVLPDLPPELRQFISGLPDGTYTYEDWEIVLSNGQITVYRWITAVYPLEAHLTPYEYQKALVGFNSAQAAYEGAKRTLDLLYAMRSDPQQIQAQVDAAEAEYRAAEAAVEMARARLEGLRAGATEEEIAAAEAQVQQAEAEVESAKAFLQKLTLVAPTNGQVLEIVRREGELAVPGTSLLTLADLDRVTLTVYVPQDRLGEVQIGQLVEVWVDSFPERAFLGRVASIADEAEFTPRNIQTEEGRTSMVFAVKVAIPNPDHALKPGMPADAVILTRER